MKENKSKQTDVSKLRHTCSKYIYIDIYIIFFNLLFFSFWFLPISKPSMQRQWSDTWGNSVSVSEVTLPTVETEATAVSQTKAKAQKIFLQSHQSVAEQTSQGPLYRSSSNVRRRHGHPCWFLGEACSLNRWERLLCFEFFLRKEKKKPVCFHFPNPFKGTHFFLNIWVFFSSVFRFSSFF